jgi:sortase A
MNAAPEANTDAGPISQDDHRSPPGPMQTVGSVRRLTLGTMVVRWQTRPWLRTSTGLVVALMLTGATWACGAEVAGPSRSSGEPTRTATPAGARTSQPSQAPGSPTPTNTANASSQPPRTTTPRSAKPAARVLASDGKPRRARLSIPALDIEGLQVEPHRGSPDDARGTRIQNRGIAGSPYGPEGGVGPGGIGNYIITAHRLSSTRAFRELPALRVGDKVQLEAGGKRYTYRIVKTRTTSFRSAKSLAAQRAPVPGRPGVRATRAMITLSTCRTPEDHAEGNYWSDEFGNPEHRIEKIGELVAVTSS